MRSWLDAFLVKKKQQRQQKMHFWLMMGFFMVIRKREKAKSKIHSALNVENIHIK